MILTQSLQRGCTWQSLFLSQRWFPKDHPAYHSQIPSAPRHCEVCKSFVPSNSSLSEGEGGERCPLALCLQSRRLWLQCCNSRRHVASLRLHHWWGTRWWLTHNPHAETLKGLQQPFIHSWDQQKPTLKIIFQTLLWREDSFGTFDFRYEKCNYG